MNTRTPTVVAAATVLFATAHFAGGAEVPDDIADMKVQDLRAGGDDRKRYFLIHRDVTPPKDGWRTLFVLPGGSGDAQFQPFVTRIAKNALPKAISSCNSSLLSGHPNKPGQSCGRATNPSSEK